MGRESLHSQNLFGARRDPVKAVSGAEKRPGLQSHAAGYGGLKLAPGACPWEEAGTAYRPPIEDHNPVDGTGSGGKRAEKPRDFVPGLTLNFFDFYAIPMGE